VLSVSGVEQFVNGQGLAAVRAFSTKPNAAAEQLAVRQRRSPRKRCSQSGHSQTTANWPAVWLVLVVPVAAQRDDAGASEGLGQAHAVTGGLAEVRGGAAAG